MRYYEQAAQDEDIYLYGQRLLKRYGYDTEGYRWYNYYYEYRDGMIPVEYIDGIQDITLNDSLFANAAEMEFHINSGVWDSVETFRGEPCTDSRRKIRSYHISPCIAGYFGDFYGISFYLDFIIGSGPAEPDRYLIYELEGRQHPDYPVDGGKPPDVDHRSPSEIKFLFYGSY